MKNFEELEVGKTYLDKNGDVVIIIEYDGSKHYPFTDIDGCSYLRDGKFLSSYANIIFDLVELIED